MSDSGEQPQGGSAQGGPAQGGPAHGGSSRDGSPRGIPQLDDATLFARLHHELAHPPFHALLAPEPMSADALTSSIVIRLPFQPRLCGSATTSQIHGGVIAALIDIAAHAAVAVQIGRAAPTVDLRIDYLRPAPGEDLYAEARTLRIGRSIARADVVVSGRDTPPLAVGRGTFSTLPLE